MKRRLCAAILTLEAIVLGLTAPVLISIQQVDVAKSLVIGLGLMLLCILTAGMLRKAWAYWLGWGIQVAAIALGLEIRAMFFLGIIFLMLWFAAVTLGERIDTHQQLAEQALPPPEDSAPVVAPARWDHELVCGPDTWRRPARQAFGQIWSRGSLLWSATTMALAVLILLVAPPARVLAFVLIAAVLLFPGVTWLAQRQSWRTFLADGRTYRTAFTTNRLVLEADGRLFEVELAQITSITDERGLVSAGLGERGTRLDLPEAVFPAAQVERVRRMITARDA